MKTYRVTVSQVVEVTLDESKFDDAFMAEFRESFFDFDTLEEHAEHIAQLRARGVIDPSWGGQFVEGYGSADEMGLTARVVEIEMEAAIAGASSENQSTEPPA